MFLMFFICKSMFLTFMAGDVNACARTLNVDGVQQLVSFTWSIYQFDSNVICRILNMLQKLFYCCQFHINKTSANYKISLLYKVSKIKLSYTMQ